MFKSAIAQQIGSILLRFALIGGTLGVVAQPTVGQMQPAGSYTLSPGAQQMLLAILNAVPEYDRPLVLNAIRMLGPQRAEAQLAQARANPLPPDVARVFIQTLQMLPPQAHQAFIDGLFQVSPAEEEFMRKVLIAQVRGEGSNVPQGPRVPPSGRDPFQSWYENGLICSLGPSTSYCGPGTYGPYWP